MIAFSGLDGAGKSTQISLLTQHYKAKGEKTEIFWSRGGYTPGIELLKKLLRKFNAKIIPKERGRSAEREKSFSNSFVRKTWITLAILDLIFYYGIYIRIKELFGVVVICDRYIIDTILDFKRNYSDEKITNWLIWKFLMKVSPYPRKHFILTISVTESQYRSKVKEEPFPDSKETLDFRLNEYKEYLTNNKSVIAIDCEKPIDVIHQQILKSL